MSKTWPNPESKALSIALRNQIVARDNARYLAGPEWHEGAAWKTYKELLRPYDDAVYRATRHIRAPVLVFDVDSGGNAAIELERSSGQEISKS